MPTYEFSCESCRAEFSIVRSMAGIEMLNATCPECQGCHVRRRYSSFFPKTSRKS